MLIYLIAQLFLIPTYCWFYLWQLGYHGVFRVIIFNLLLSSYAACTDFFQSWMWDVEYTLTPAVWLEFGNCEIVCYAVTCNFLSAMVLLIMTLGASFVLIFVYVEMWDDKEGANFAILLLFFLGFMSILTTSANLFIFYLGWEGIGLTSLFLISFWSERARAIKATLKVYTINKIGDYLLLSAISLLFIHANTTNFDALNLLTTLLSNYDIYIGNTPVNIIELVSALFVLGGGVKSAQFGFHIWLLEAMEAPLGASALMHSSTLVIAGVVLNYKLNLFIEHAYIATLILIGWGSWTALFAALIACFQYELKIIMAYSTISSMGFLYCLLGLHAYDVLLKYLVIHAFIKIFFFLTMGAVILHCNGCQDIRWMGGLLHYIPGLYICYIIGSLTLAGLPYWSGYYCKSAAWFAAAAANHSIAALQLIMLVTNLLTYCYLVRTGYLIFFNIKNGHRSIYRVRYQSPLVSATFGVLSLGVAYTGALWNHACTTTLTATQHTLLAVYDVSLQLIACIPAFAWIQLIIIYILLLISIYIMLLRTLGAYSRAIQSFFVLYISTALSLAIYIIL